MALLFISIAPQVGEFPLIPVFGVVVGLVISYLLWDANKSVYDRMCNILTDRLHEE